MQKLVATFLLVVLAILLFVKSHERDRLSDWAKWRLGQIADWFEGLGDFEKALLGSAVFTLLTVFFTWLTAPWIQAALVYLN